MIELSQLDSHLKHAKFHGISNCHVHHITFGGRCLNCGFDPESVTAAPSAKVTAIVDALDMAQNLNRSW